SPYGRAGGQRVEGALQRLRSHARRYRALRGADRPAFPAGAARRGVSVVIRVLREHLRPYARTLLGVAVFQLLATIASLYLPTLNADIIDLGIVKGDTGYILRTGGWMLLMTLGQIAFSVAAAYFGARASMRFGRDLRAALFRGVMGFSGREMAKFGAPSLITRTTND